MKIARTTNKESAQYVANLRTFKASNLQGRDYGSPAQFGMSPRYYVVESYGWYPIYVFDRLTTNWYVNKEGYSQSTKRQISQARPTSFLYPKTHQELKDMLNESPRLILENAV